MLKLDDFYKNVKMWSEACWETCGGSHCCKLFRFSKDLQFAPKDSQLLHLYDFEVDWLIKNNQLDPAFMATLKQYKFKFKEKSLTYYSVQCGYGGLCPNHKYRPISCFLYPYVPYFSPDRKIESLANLSAYDDLYDTIGVKKPCTLYDKFNTQTYLDVVDQYLSDPAFYFYTNTYIRIKALMIERFKAVSPSSDLVENLKVFEMMVALRRLVTPQEVQAIMNEENEKFKFIV